MDYLVDELSVGMPIFVYGINVQRDELLPSPAPEPGEDWPRAPLDDSIISPAII